MTTAGLAAWSPFGVGSEREPISTMLPINSSRVTFASVKYDGVQNMVNWDKVTRDHVVRALHEYDKLGAERFFGTHGFAPTTTFDLIWEKRTYPPKAILGTAYEFATGHRLKSSDFEGGKSGAVKVLESLGFTVQPK